MEDITEGDGVAVLDRPVASFVTAHRTGVLTMVMEAASSAGGPVVLGAVTVAAGVVLGTIWRSLGPVLAAGVTVAGNGVLTVVLKDAVGRPRPLRSRAARVAIWASASMLTTLVGISRIYLGVHWTTDVLGGWVFGALWLAVVVTGSTVLAHGRGRGGSSSEPGVIPRRGHA